METMESQCCVFLGIKVKPGPIERFKIENFTLDNTVDTLKNEAGKKANIPSTSLELIHHGKILKDNATLQDSGVKSGEMVHVVKKKEQAPTSPPLNFSEAELQQLNASLRTLGCTPNAPGWTRAMQLLNDESALAEIMEHAPSLADDCVTLSILHEVELLAALGANVTTMRRGADAHPDLVVALRHLMRLVRNRSSASANDNAPTSGFAYSLEALSEDEDGEEEGGEEGEDGEGRGAITQEQLAAALQAVTEAVLSPARGGHEGLLRLLQAAGEPGDSAPPAPIIVTEQPTTGAPRAIITAEMFSEAITDALNRTTGGAAGSGPVAGPPLSLAGLPLSLAGSSLSLSGPPASSTGSPVTIAGPPTSLAGPATSLTDSPMSLAGPTEPLTDSPMLLADPSAQLTDSPMSLAGPPLSSTDPPMSLTDPSVPLAGPQVPLVGASVSISSPQAPIPTLPAPIPASPEPGTSASTVTPMEHSTTTSSPAGSPTAGTSSGSLGARGRPTRPQGEFEPQLQRMHELGLLDDAINVRALQICSGDVNAAINLVFSEDMEDGI